MQVNIPASLVSEIEKAVTAPTSPEDFVLQAVREKLSWEDRRRQFCHLSEDTHAALRAKGLSEADILRDFEAFRSSLSEPIRG